MSIEIFTEILKVSGQSGVLALVIWALLRDHSLRMKELFDQHNKLLEKVFDALKTNQETSNATNYHLGQIITVIEGCKRGDHRRD
ncbi:MAG: hypothetical protein HQK97_04510 [Nitrospirae bacterium]|nr:hypothetical protein [Nitrospirota bacterium]